MSMLSAIRRAGGRPWLWGAPLAVWFVFTLWYTNTAGPLSAEEIASFAERAAADGAGPERVRRLLRFMKEDTGSQFLMVNLLDLATGEAASESMDRYMAHMLPEMLKRASHPTLAGNAVFSAMDIAGIEGAEHWTSAGIVRYRSRRDLLDIGLAPVFAGEHEFKLAALDKTIAVPIETSIHLGDLRVLLLLAVLAIAGVADALLYRRRT